MSYIFKPYLEKIANTVGANANLHESRNYFEKGYNSFTGSSAASKPANDATGMQKLANLLGLELNTPSFGNHPDFKHLIDNQLNEYHYATAVFQDVKGSTSLLEKYTLEQVHSIINMISVVTTHTHGLFAGHIQRLQYDGVFSYFVRKNLDKRQAVFNSLCATAFCSYFIKYELRPFFSNVHGFDKIYTKTGIDFGDNNEVMWAPFGVQDCYEISTNSLHTSFAFKIQEKSKLDEICVGSNVVNLLSPLKEYFHYHRTPSGELDNIAWQGEKAVCIFYNFHWENFLLDLFSDFVKKDKNRIYIDYDANNSTDIPRIASLRNKALLTKIGLGKVDSTGKYNVIGDKKISNSSDYAY